MDDVTKQLQEEITILQSELDRITAQTSQFKTEIRTAKKEMTRMRSGMGSAAGGGGGGGTSDMKGLMAKLR
eukprot:COSAG06_NODE_47184_length_341_cov_0.640496_1_plen_70_part_10